jgi:hypothetical protein
MLGLTIRSSIFNYFELVGNLHVSGHVGLALVCLSFGGTDPTDDMGSWQAGGTLCLARGIFSLRYFNRNLQIRRQEVVFCGRIILHRLFHGPRVWYITFLRVLSTSVKSLLVSLYK